MKKRLLVLLVAMLGMTLRGFSQTVSLDIKAPKGMKVVKIVGTDVNLRKAPSAQSERLVWTEDWTPKGTLYWLNWKSGKLDRDDKPAHATVLPVISKLSGGWLCGAYCSRKVHVMEKYCKEVALRPLQTPADIIDGDEEIEGNYVTFCEFHRIATGKYKDFVLGIMGRGSLCSLYLGQYIDGMFAFNYSVEFGIFDERPMKSTLYEGNFSFAKSLAADKDAQTPDLKKLGQDTYSMDLLVREFKSNPEKYRNIIVFYGVEGDNKWHAFRDKQVE